MAYNTEQIKKDYDGKPVPQYFNAVINAYEALQGRNGANRVEIFDASGNPIDFETLLTNIVTELGRVEIASSVLPTGAATEAKQDTMIGWIDTIEALLTSIKSTDGIKKLTDALPAGDNNIGNVDIASAIPAGANTIGSVKTAGNDTMLQGNITLSGAAQQVNANTPCRVVTIQAEPTNQGYIYIGKSDVSGTVHMATLGPGSSMTITCSNLNLLFVLGTSGDKVCYGGEA